MRSAGRTGRPSHSSPPTRNGVRIGVQARNPAVRCVGRTGPAPARPARRASARKSGLGPTGPATAARRLAASGVRPHLSDPSHRPRRRSHRRAEPPPQPSRSSPRLEPQSPPTARAAPGKAADSLATVRRSAPPAGAADLAAGQFRGAVVAARCARQQLERRPGRQRGVGLVGVRQRAITRQGFTSLAEHRRTAVGAAVLAG